MKFRLWVAGPSGAPFALEVDASSTEAAHAQVSSNGLAVLGNAGAFSASLSSRAGARSRFDVLLFTQQLLALLSAGLTVVEGLRALASQTDASARPVVGAMLAKLGEGQSFADALTGESEFPELYVSLVRASEQTSDLPTALERYLAYATQMNEVRQKLVSAGLYPALLITAGGAAIVFLLTYVVPRFSGIYEGMRGDLPWAATLMMRWGEIVKGHGAEMFVALAAISVTIASILSSVAARRWLGQQLLRFPWIGEELRLYHISRLYRTLGMLLEGGITLTRALQMSANLLPASLRRSGDVVMNALREGQRPSASFQGGGLSTPIADQMLAVGERSGDLGRMMTRIAEFYEGDTARKLERAMRVFEPILMTIIGLGIGVVVILMYLPIFELAGSIQ